MSPVGGVLPSGSFCYQDAGGLKTFCKNVAILLNFLLKWWHMKSWYRVRAPAVDHVAVGHINGFVYPSAPHGVRSSVDVMLTTVCMYTVSHKWVAVDTIKNLNLNRVLCSSGLNRFTNHLQAREFLRLWLPMYDRDPSLPIHWDLMTHMRHITEPTVSLSNDLHYTDVIMSAMASQITSLGIAYSTVYKLQWIFFNQNSYIFIQENPIENAVWKIAALLYRPQCALPWGVLSTVIF